MSRYTNCIVGASYPESQRESTRGLAAQPAAEIPDGDRTLHGIQIVARLLQPRHSFRGQLGTQGNHQIIGVNEPLNMRSVAQEREFVELRLLVLAIEGDAAAAQALAERRVRRCQYEQHGDQGDADHGWPSGCGQTSH